MADTRLADRSSAAWKQAQTPTEPAVAPPADSKTLRPSASRAKSSPAPPETAPSGNIAQIRDELASTQKTRGALESRVSILTAELSTIKARDAEQKKRITQLENHKQQLERRMKDRADELRAKVVSWSRCRMKWWP
jgi:septal ring factor EnvC (AmiA/AmiB activator)